MAAPVAHGSSRVRGRIRAAAEAYTTARATLDPSCICELHLQQCWILNPLSEAGVAPRTSWTLCQVLNLLSPTAVLSFILKN